MVQRRPGLAAGLAIGALLAFPAGLMLGRGGVDRQPDDVRRSAAQASDGLRDPYSPDLLGDPAFVAQQRKNLEALEKRCEQSGAFCAEAEAFRRALDAQ